MQEVGQRITDMVKRVLDGEQTKAEMNQQEGIVCLYTLHPAF
jgi:altronate dehydratase